MDKVLREVTSLTRIQLLNMLTALDGGKFTGAVSNAWRYARHRNIETIRAEMVKFEEIYPVPAAWSEYNRRVMDIYRKYNLPFGIGVQLSPKDISPDVRSLVEAELLSLDAETRDARKEQEQELMNRDKAMNTSPELELVKIQIEEAPQVDENQPNGYNADWVFANGILPMITEPFGKKEG